MNAQRVQQAPAGPGTRWQYRRLLTAPHRLAFSAATLLLALSSLWWAAIVLMGSEGVAVRWALPPATAHSVLMSFGFMPLFFVGFLFTAGPKWLQVPPVKAAMLVEPVATMLAGWAVFLLSLHGRDADFGRTLGAFGMGAVAVGWFGIVRRFLGLLRASRAPDRLHATLIATGCVYGLLAMAAVAAGLAIGSDAVVRAATRSSLWAFVGWVFATVAHRMVPLFSGPASPAFDAWRPSWLLGGFSALFAVEAAAAVSDAMGLPATGPALFGLALVEIVAGLSLTAMALNGWRSPSVRLRLPAMLHLGFSWLALAVLFTGLSRMLEWVSQPLSLGLAPTHAFTMGFLGSMMFAMVTRVTCGQGGRTVVADDFVWRLFGVLQIAVAARLAAALLTHSSPVRTWALLAAAAIGWAGVCVSWALRYGRQFGLPRLDGRPG